MERVTIYLRTALFSTAQESHVPLGVMVIEGEVLDRPAGALTVRCDKLLDDRAKSLAEGPMRLQIPWSKIDHLLFRED